MKVNNIDLEIKFILNNLTTYQKQTLVIKKKIFLLYNSMKSQNIKIMDIYYNISKEVNIEPDTIRKILKKIK
jgi:hypothetical protein